MEPIQQYQYPFPIPDCFTPDENGHLLFKQDFLAVKDDTPPESGGRATFKSRIKKAADFGRTAEGHANNFFSVGRAGYKLTQIWHSLGNLPNQLFSATRLASLLTAIGDVADSIVNIKNTIEAPTPLEKGVHASGAAAAIGNIFNNVWTFVIGLSTVTSVAQPALDAFNVVGPVGWAMSAFALIPTAYQWHIIDETLRNINKDRPKKTRDGQDPVEIRKINMRKRIGVFNQFTLDKDHNLISSSALKEKLHLSARLPFIEGKYELRESILVIEKCYFEAAHFEQLVQANGGDVKGGHRFLPSQRITDRFVRIIQRHYRITKLHFGLKALAVAIGLVALLFFYVPGFKSTQFSSQIAWGFLIAAGVIGFTATLSGKVNTNLFLKNIEELKARAVKQLATLDNQYFTLNNPLRNCLIE